MAFFEALLDYLAELPLNHDFHGVAFALDLDEDHFRPKRVLFHFEFPLVERVEPARRRVPLLSEEVARGLLLVVRRLLGGGGAVFVGEDQFLVSLNLLGLSGVCLESSLEFFLRFREGRASLYHRSVEEAFLFREAIYVEGQPVEAVLGLGLSHSVLHLRCKSAGQDCPADTGRHLLSSDPNMA